MPVKLYKYQPINQYTLRNLAASQLWVSDPTKFNDPFEFRLPEAESFKIIPSIDELRQKSPRLEPKTDEKIAKMLRDELQKKLNHMGVICLTKSHENLPMWAHYADHHRGICLEFSCDSIEGLNKLGIHHVDYSNDYPNKLDLTKNIWNVRDGNLVKIMFQKSDHWTYEEEFRSVRLNIRNSPISYSTKWPLTGIIFGARTSEEDIHLIKSIVSTSQNLTFYQSSLHPSKYAVKIVPLA